MFIISSSFGIDTSLTAFKFMFLIFFTIFLFSILYISLSKFLNSFLGEKFPHKKLIVMLLSVSSTFILTFIVLSSPFGKYLVEVVLPFVLFSIFFLMLIYVFFSALGIKFGSGDNEEGFITIVSPIVMWAGIGLLLIAFLATLKQLGYKIIDKMLQPSILGILVFFIVVGLFILSIESEEK